MKIDNYVPKNKRRLISDQRIKCLKRLSHWAIISAYLMYVAYIPEIIQNLNGHPVSPIQPLMATMNATLWTFYGWYKTYRDWPVVISNVPGIIFGVLTLVSIVMH